MSVLRTLKSIYFILSVGLAMNSPAIDDVGIKKHIEDGSEKVIELKERLKKLRGTPELRKFAIDLQLQFNIERSRCSGLKPPIRKLLDQVKKTGDINLRDEKGRTLIMLVADLGNDAATQLVLKESPDLTLWDQSNRIAMDYELLSEGCAITNHLTPLWNNALKTMNAEDIQHLLNCGAAPNWSVEETSPLELAIKGKHHNVTEVLISHGALDDKKEKKQNTFIELAVTEKNAQAVNLILGTLKETNIIFKDGTPMYQKLMNDESTECLSALITQAQQLNKQHTPEGTSYFCLAMRLATTKSAKAIAAQHSNLISTEDPEGNLPLHEAARRGNVELYHELIKLGASPTQKNSAGETTLMHAVWSGNPDMLKEVLNGLSPEQIKEKSKQGYSALDCAKSVHDTAAAEILKAAAGQ